MTLISLHRVSFVVMKDFYKKSNVANYLQYELFCYTLVMKQNYSLSSKNTCTNLLVAMHVLKNISLSTFWLTCLSLFAALSKIS